MNWPDALRFAVLHLGLSPDQFWRLSLKDWRTLTAAAQPPLSRRELEAMIAGEGSAAGHMPPRL